MTFSNVAKLPTKYGNFFIQAFKDGCQEHLAIMSETFHEMEIPNVRIHSECLTGDTLGSLKCDCNNQLHLALEYINKNGGLVIYHRQEGRNIGLLNKINAYHLQDKGFDTIEANKELGFKEDERDYTPIAFILNALGVKKLNLITNNPDKINFLKDNGIEVLKRIKALTPINIHNENYLQTKKESMGHLL
jgi:GTP cyclohydrolase II